MKTFNILFVLALSVALLSSAQAADKYTVDALHSSVQFKVAHKGAGFTHGRFNQFEGKILIDKKNIAKSSIDLTIKAASVDTGFEKREQHLKSPDFLNAKQFPVIQFKSTKIKSTGPKTADIEGDFTLLGVTRKITAKATLTGNPTGLIGLEAKAVIKRSEFGNKFGLEMLGDQVFIYIAVEGGISDENS
jgi:polyisoprenoid-binding protein YceI